MREKGEASRGAAYRNGKKKLFPANREHVFTSP